MPPVLFGMVGLSESFPDLVSDILHLIFGDCLDVSAIYEFAVAVVWESGHEMNVSMLHSHTRNVRGDPFRSHRILHCLGDLGRYLEVLSRVGYVPDPSVVAFRDN